MEIRKAFRYRVYPTAAQEARLFEWEHTLRFLWNLALEQRVHRLSKTDRVYLNSFSQQRDLTELRADVPWIGDLPRHACAHVIDDLDAAWGRWLLRAGGKPRFKRKGYGTTSMRESDPQTFRIDSHRVRFPKLGWLRATIHRPMEGAPKTCAITRDVDQWFVSISCVVNIPDPVNKNQPCVGLDRGVTNLIADSNGRVVQSSRPFERKRRQLARAQRSMSRKTKGSKNREKARLRAAKLYRKVRRQRDWVLHVESNRYANSHGTVVVERLQTRNMVKGNRGLARGILDAGWGRFAEYLSYKLLWAGGNLVEVNPAYTSQTCSRCDHVAPENRLGEKFKCVACGHCDHADVNAAIVICSRGSLGGAACGGYGTSRPLKQEALSPVAK